MKIILDEDKCVASGQCVMAADAVFDQRDEDGIAFLLTDSPTAEHEDDVHHAAAVCPARAIEIES